ncbi:uncharacterized protein BJ171DRAFT_499039 [Polychytrium aggregatum]|uniref:uncharacterized protein n=1 Tax=Polychytrium aggregatum TaxID=110093 RepID=UPI0022FE4CE6|nr:uncharacterized protein BJ171DRAFT_499039 [Polychytrium aggregatum]KAI9206182.1 hypothetical protein BJ171DRAFT_499039 [Polychytrium aggregatum]
MIRKPGQSGRRYRPRPSSNQADEEEEATFRPDPVEDEQSAIRPDSRAVLLQHLLESDDADSGRAERVVTERDTAETSDATLPDFSKHLESALSRAKYRIACRSSPQFGRSIYAMEDIPAGATVYECVPAACVVDDAHLSRFCSGCFQPNGRFRCSRCTIVHYCSEICLKSDWPFHKTECKGFQNVAPRKPTTAVRQVGRLLTLQQTPSPSSILMQSLVTHRGDYSTSHLEAFTQMSVLVKLIRKHEQLEASTMLDHFCRMGCNSMTICDRELSGIGVGLYPELSLLNHSCDPNCFLVFSGCKASLRVLRPIHQGQQLFLSYIDVTDPAGLRKKELGSRYFFDCKCTLCENEADDPRHRWSCLDSACTGFVCVTDPFEELQTAACSECGPLEISKLEAFERRRKDLAASHIKTAKSQHSGELRRQVEQARSVLKAGNTLLVRALKQLLDVQISSGVWEDALPTCSELLDNYKQILDPRHPTIAIQTFVLAKLASAATPQDAAHRPECRAQLTWAVQKMRDAAQATERSMGTAHALHREVAETLGGIEAELAAMAVP